MTANNEAFIIELKALLKKHKVVLTAKDHYIGYAECGEDIRITAEFHYPDKDLNLGKYFDADGLAMVWED